MYTMQAAIALSVGNKAKARTSDGDTIVVEAHYHRIEYDWTLNRILLTGGHCGYGYGGNFGELRKGLNRHDISPDECIWLPVEMPFPGEDSI